MPTKEKLSELEATVLGLVWAEGPCTAYTVRRTVQDSLSVQWSGSAGAVYPAVERLQRRGLIRAQSQATGRRKSQALSVTPKGVRALTTWLGPPVDPLALGIAADPLRVRLRFAELLPPDKLADFLDESIESLRETVATVQNDVRRAEASRSRFEVAMARGALYATEGRLRMLTELKASLAT